MSNSPIQVTNCLKNQKQVSLSSFSIGDLNLINLYSFTFSYSSIYMNQILEYVYYHQYITKIYPVNAV